MKKLFAISIALLATVTFARAQQEFQNMSVEERAKTQTERIEKLLSLNADQKTKVQAIDLDLAKQMDAKMRSNQGDREAMRSAIQEIDKVRDDKYKAVLTADQFKKYLEDKEQRQRQRNN
jgi:hypothetical protein